MVSQPSMRRILRTGICLLGLSAMLAACGQGEGGRCQVDSDCASGLVCLAPSYGNGTCGSGVDNATADAAANDDTSSDEVSTSPDLGPDTPSSSAIDLASLASMDSEGVDAGGID
jgi:hypothetical protein